MTIVTHDKVYQNPSECTIGNIPALKATKMEIVLDTLGNPIDNIIYLLMCAEMKREDPSLAEQMCAISRYQKALEQLQEYVGNYSKDQNPANPYNKGSK